MTLDAAAGGGGARLDDAQDFDRIPVVSLATLDGTLEERTDLAHRLCEISHRVGFFVVVDHGVAAGVVDDVFDHMAAFFALPDDVKSTIDKRESPWFRGWEAVGSELTNNRVDVREQIDVWTEWPAEPTTQPPYHPRLHGPNQWLDDRVLPGQRQIVERWMHELGSLADRLLSSLAVGLGLDAGHFAEWFGDRPMSLTKLIHYPPTPDGGAGVNAHHDTGFLTVLAPGDVPGLQVATPSGDWIDVPRVDGGFVVNLGEMLQALTGNFFVATPHRVIAPVERLSAAYFHGPSLDTRLDPLDLDPSFAARVAASPRHATAGFMASASETDAGVDDMASAEHAPTYGDQLWRYFARSYPEHMRRHHPDAMP
ncbi:MAG: 2-oxoglutarate and iron-dependent oxygenase domain-containing protein [Actinomycetota bacterium]